MNLPIKMQISNPSLLLIIIALTFASFPTIAHAREAKEDSRIEHLISSVEKLTGAKFIRNGKEYDPKKAGSHLRMKLKRAGDKVSTAESFINVLAAKSSFSGKPYTIRNADGTVVKTIDYFHARLNEYDKTKSAR